MSAILWKIEYSLILREKFEWSWTEVWSIACNSYLIAKEWRYSPYEQFSEDYRES